MKLNAREVKLIRGRNIMTEFETKMEDLCTLHGVKWNENSPKLIGQTLEFLKKRYEEDNNLNNIPLHVWDRLATPLASRKGLSLSVAVCMQKHAAKKLIGVFDHEKETE